MNFEKHAASQLHAYGSNLDVERLWGNIDRELRPTKKPVVLLPLVLGALGFALLAVMFFFVKNEKGKSPEAASPAATQPEKIDEQKDNPTLVSVFPVQETTNSSRSIKEEKSDTKGTITLISKEKMSEKEVLALEPIAEIQSKSTFIAADKNEIYSSIQSTSLSENAPLGFTNHVSIQNSFVKAAHLLPSRPINRLSVMLNNDLPADFDRSPDLGCYSFGKKNSWKPYLGIYAGAQKPLKTLKTDNNEAQPLVDLRKETETVLEGVVGGAFLGLLHPSGFHFELGGEYNRINEKFEYIVTEVDTIGKTLTTGFVINAPGDTTFVMDSVFVIQSTESVKKIYNKYSYVQIPITVGYEFNTEARFTPYIKGGIMVNISFEQKAEIMTSPSTSVLYESNNERADHPFRTRIGISPHISLGARLELNSWMHLFGELRYVHHLKTSTHGDYPIEQKYKLPGLNIGLRFFKPIRYD